MKLRLPAFAILALTWTLQSCTTLPPREADRAERLRLHGLKSDRLVEQDRWNLSGKLAISNDKDGGSGKLQWRENPGYTRMDFHGTLGRGAWRLEADRSGARLELADGSAYEDQTVDQLVQKQVGWEIPVESLSWWVRGMAAPGGAEERWFDERGNLVRLNQDGWSIEFGKYRSFGEFEMPIRLTAMQAEWKVKLVVRRWELAPESAPDD